MSDEVHGKGGRYPEPWLLPRSLRPAYRFVLGRPMDNIRRTNSTWLHAATEGYPSRWLRLPGWKRTVARIGALYTAAWVPVVGVAEAAQAIDPSLGWADALDLPSVLAGHGFTGTAIACPIVAARTIRDYGVSVPVPVIARDARGRLCIEDWTRWTRPGRKEWDREVLRPLAAVMDSVLGTRHHPGRASRWIDVPRDYRTPGGSPVIINLPPGYTGADRGTQERLVRAASARLGIRDPDVEWQLQGSHPRVLISTPPVPPTQIGYAEVLRYLESAEEWRPFLGLTARASALFAEMVGDSPHIALSAGPGAGKSELVKLVTMQCMHQGWGTVILDWKEVSHEWAEGLPGVRIVRDIEDIHEWIIRLGQEFNDRKRAYRVDRTLPGRAKLLVVCEEMNATADLLTAYWQDLRATAEPDERRVMPIKSPAIRALNGLIFGGRQLGIHMLFVAQRFSARITQGNADVRECFGIKLMARYTQATVKMLCPEVKPFPRKPGSVGGWVVVANGEATTIQAPLITDEEAIEFATNGKPNPDHPLTRTYLSEPSERQCMPGTQEEELRPVGARPALTGEVLPRVEPRKLSDLVEGLAPLGITLAVLQKAARSDDQGDREFPPPIGGAPFVGYKYDAEEVKEWARRRHARMAAQRNLKQKGAVAREGKSSFATESQQESP